MQPAKYLPLSVITITNVVNESLKQALTSCQWAQERVVVVTADVLIPAWLPRLATTVHRVPAVTDFSQVRNQAAQWATQPWLLYLDSDERVPEDTFPALAAAVADNTAAGFWVYRHDFFYGQPVTYGELAGFKLVRLVRAGTFHFERPVHEVAVVDGQLKQSQIILTHYPHPTVAHFLAQVSSYAQAEATYRFHQHLRASLLEMIAYPVAKFWWLWLGKQGWRDGWVGFVYSWMMAMHSLLVRVYLREKYLEGERE